ncbi:MAG: hypothetical protein ACI4B8_00575 [Candidatus Gastranaerophilaceae bacterium]|jgi:bifunctional DNA-binding transcriptional regulator/antitoxin component of YhaV-PrlF toxin-antitoxin module
MADSLEILPKTVRALLNINNDEILHLCKEGDVPLRQNAKGLTYFTTEDVKTLKKLQEIQAKTKSEPVIQLKNSLKKLPAKRHDAKSQLPENSSNAETVALLKQISAAVTSIESGVYNKFSVLLEEKLEEKLGGIDEVIMDLVRSKAEAEQMRKDMAEKDKEIYALKNELSSFRQIIGSIYIKQELEDEFDED